MRKRTALTLAVVTALAGVGTALATMPSGIAVTTFVRATLDANKPHDGVKAYSGDQVKLQTKGATDVAVQTITSPPGGSSGWHSHPGVVLVAVQVGTVTLYDAHCHTTQYGPGQAFVEVGDHALLVRNNTTLNAVLYVTLIVPKSAPLLRIDKPQPATCAAS
jgi:quercetin dioxygenase-like cupin family protein